MARESAILLCSAASDERLTAALQQIEELSGKLEAEKQERIAQVRGREGREGKELKY